MERSGSKQTSLPPPTAVAPSPSRFSQPIWSQYTQMDFELEDYAPVTVLSSAPPLEFFVHTLDPNFDEYAEIIRRLGGVLLDSLPTNPDHQARLVSSDAITGQRGLWGDYLRELIRIGRFAPQQPYEFGNHQLDHGRQQHVLHLHQRQAQQQQLQQSQYQHQVDIMSQHQVIATAAASLGRGLADPSPQQHMSLQGALESTSDPFSNALNSCASVATTRPHHRYNDEKDEFILEQVRLHPHLRNTHHLFLELAKESVLMGHTGNSIRSRYRKVLAPRLDYVYKINARGEPERDKQGNLVILGPDQLPATLKNRFNGDDDYAMCRMARDYLLDRDVDIFDGSRESQAKFALPYTFFSALYKKCPTHSLHSWRDRYRKHVGEGTLSRYIDYYNDCHVKGLTPRPLLRISDDKVKLEQFKSIDSMRGERKRNSVERDLLEATAPIVQEQLKRAQYENNENIDAELLNHPPHQEYVTPPLQAEMDEVANAVADALGQHPSSGFIKPEHVESRTDGGITQLAIEYVDEDVEFVDLLDGNDILAKTKQFFEKVQAICDSTENAIKLFELFSAIGIKEPLTSHAIRATTAVLDVIPLFLRRFLERLELDLNQEEGLRMCELLVIKGEKGIWNQEYDSWLGTGNEHLLEPYFLAEEIEERKAFLPGMDALLPADS